MIKLSDVKTWIRHTWPRLVAVLDSRPALRVLQAIVIVSLVAGAYTSFRQTEIAACQTAYNERTAKALVASRQLSDGDWAALDGMLRGILTAQSPDIRRQLYVDYLDQRAKSTAERAKHPLPAPPSTYCG